MTTEFLYPLLYTGPKVDKVVTVPGYPNPVTFSRGPLSEQFDNLPYADVTEAQGRFIVKRWGDIFKWPADTKLGPQFVTRDEHEALAARVAALETLLTPAEPEAPKRGRKAAEPVEA